VKRDFNISIINESLCPEMKTKSVFPWSFLFIRQMKHRWIPFLLASNLPADTNSMLPGTRQEFLWERLLELNPAPALLEPYSKFVDKMSFLFKMPQAKCLRSRTCKRNFILLTIANCLSATEVVYGNTLRPLEDRLFLIDEVLLLKKRSFTDLIIFRMIH